MSWAKERVEDWASLQWWKARQQSHPGHPLVARHLQGAVGRAAPSPLLHTDRNHQQPCSDPHNYNCTQSQACVAPKQRFIWESPKTLQFKVVPKYTCYFCYILASEQQQALRGVATRGSQQMDVSHIWRSLPAATPQRNGHTYSEPMLKNRAKGHSPAQQKMGRRHCAQAPFCQSARLWAQK